MAGMYYKVRLQSFDAWPTSDDLTYSPREEQGMAAGRSGVGESEYNLAVRNQLVPSVSCSW